VPGSLRRISRIASCSSYVSVAVRFIVILSEWDLLPSRVNEKCRSGHALGFCFGIESRQCLHADAQLYLG
jgi:hypothetical protein